MGDDRSYDRHNSDTVMVPRRQSLWRRGHTPDVNSPSARNSDAGAFFASGGEAAEAGAAERSRDIATGRKSRTLGTRLYEGPVRSPCLAPVLVQLEQPSQDRIVAQRAVKDVFAPAICVSNCIIERSMGLIKPLRALVV